MNINKKLFFILIFSCLFLIPNISKAQTLATSACVNNPGYCGSLSETSCRISSVCSWNAAKSSCQNGNTNCSVKSYAECALLPGFCTWNGPILDASAVKTKAAAPAAPIIVPKIDNPTSILYIESFIGNIVNSVFGLVGSIALLMFIYGGVSWMTAGGNSEKVKKSRDTLVWAALGLAFIFLSYAVASIVIKMLS